VQLLLCDKLKLNKKEEVMRNDCTDRQNGAHIGVRVGPPTVAPKLETTPGPLVNLRRLTGAMPEYHVWGGA